MTHRNLIPVFAGPSLSSGHRPEGPFQWLPPARAGDLARLLGQPLQKLCLIDGLFDSCPAPWHKELLMLMAQGTQIYGASSMGALRAAELSSFGMTGVGYIYEAYAKKHLHGDDEVALIHATERLDWVPLTIPMVELRATLVRACRVGLLSVPQARRLRSAAKAVHFSDRDWPVIARVASRERLVDEFSMGMLEAMHVPLKRLDALACLREALKPAERLGPCRMPPLTCFVRGMLSPRDQA